MKTFLGVLMLLLSATGPAQVPHVGSGSTVFIEPSGGFEHVLAAAFIKKKVPVVVVTDLGRANYVIRSTIASSHPAQPQVVINNTNGDANRNTSFESGWSYGKALAAAGHTEGSISVIDIRTSQVVFAYSAGKGANTNQVQSIAEACAKHLRESIEKPGK